MKIIKPLSLNFTKLKNLSSIQTAAVKGGGDTAETSVARGTDNCY